MSTETIIAWTNYTFNPFMGCTKVAHGCTNCYAEVLTKNRMGLAIWGPRSRRQMTGQSIWSNPAKWNRQAQKEGIRHRVFCASLCDVFEDFDGPVTNAKEQRLYRFGNHGEIVPEPFRGPEYRAVTLDDLRRRLFEQIDATPMLDWQLLTKRPENIARMWPLRQCCGYNSGGLQPHCSGCGKSLAHRPNVWLGTSISEQESGDKNIPELLKCRELAPVLFVSYEPALGPIDFRSIADDGHNAINCLTGNRIVNDMVSSGPAIDWIICGGESGPGFRPMDLDWARSARDQCKAADVAYFYKQASAIRTEMGIELDGQIVREYPAV